MFIKGPSGTIEKILHLAITQESLFKKKKNSPYPIPSLICGLGKEMIQRNLFTKQKQTHRE